MLVPPPFDRLRARVILPAIPVVTLLLLMPGLLIPATRPLAESLMGAMLIFDAAIILVLLAAARRAGLDWNRLLGPTPPNTEWRLASIALPLMALSYGGFWLFWQPLSFLAPDLVQSYALEGMPDLLTRDNPARLILDVVVIVVVAPVVEEILFRGILLHRWAARWGMTTGVILSSTLFAILHIELVGHFFFGVVMAALYVRTGSLWMPIIAHAANNALVVALTLPDTLSGTEPTTPTMAEFRAEWPAGLVALLIGAAVLAWFWRRYGPRGAWRLPYSSAGPAPAPIELATHTSPDASFGEAP